MGLPAESRTLPPMSSKWVAPLRPFRYLGIAWESAVHHEARSSHRGDFGARMRASGTRGKVGHHTPSIMISVPSFTRGERTASPAARCHPVPVPQRSTVIRIRKTEPSAMFRSPTGSPLTLLVPFLKSRCFIRRRSTFQPVLRARCHPYILNRRLRPVCRNQAESRRQDWTPRRLRACSGERRLKRLDCTKGG